MKVSVHQFAGSLLTLGFAASVSGVSGQTKPNVVFILADELRSQDLGYTGNSDVLTPNLDRLASRSVNFINTISGCPVSCPYRGSLMTGKYPLSTGVFVNDVQLDPEAETFPKVFRRAGYNTAYIGKWHLDGYGRSSFIPADRRHEFEYWKTLECTHDYYNSLYWDNDDRLLKWEGYDAYAQTADAASYIASRKGNEKPFLLFLSLGPPHTPFDRSPANLKQYYRSRQLSLRKNVPADLSDRAIADLTGYYAHITALDSCVGVLQKAVADAGLDENTIFIFTSDHGAMVRSHSFNNKQRHFEESIHVPLLIRSPSVLGDQGRVNDMLINTPDLMPTLLGLCGLPIPSGVEGEDKSTAMRGLKKDKTEAVLIACYHPFGQYTRKIGGKEFRGVRTKQYTYVRDLNGPWMLFDNHKDPFQLNNVIDDKSYDKVRKDLDRQLAALLKKQNDEFLPGMEYIKKWGYVTDENETVPYTKINFRGEPIILVSAERRAPELYKAVLQNDTLVIENDVIWQKFLWNNGNLIRAGFGRKGEKGSVILPDKRPNVSVGSVAPAMTGSGSLEVREIEATPLREAHLSVEVISSSEDLSVRRIYRIYPGCPAFANEIYIKGKMPDSGRPAANQGDLRNIESEAARLQAESSSAVIELLRTDGPHWKATSVEFFDITDRNNTLVQEYERLAYRQETQLRGNLLLLENRISGDRLFILKEAPASTVQLNYPGFDFTVKQGEVKAVGMGIAPADINDSEWTRVYSAVTGIALSREKHGLLTSLRQYQDKIRKHIPERDEMILMNTWGDRSQDKKVNESFAMAELEAGSRLGITHFQLDDGWQTGRSANSAFEGGSFDNIWRNPGYWIPDPSKFPSGLGPLVQKGRQMGIEVCVWFNPSPDDGNINWEKDADALIELYKKYGIRTFKIDGVKMPDKKSEINFRRFLDKVVSATGGNALFNLDVTAGRRAGYHYFNEYGNLFLENRYTDWRNYYPFWTLRNLWMLSGYVPAQKLQIEFLNIWRNRNNYSGDPLAPSGYSFDYVFAVTMMAQPLAWFEGTGLPDEAFKTSELIKKYRSIQSDIHSGVILPLGDEPDGYSWTGFQSLKKDNGYILIFREKNGNGSAPVRTWFGKGEKISFTPVLGEGRQFESVASDDGTIIFSLDKPDSFSLYSYKVIK